MSSTKRKAPPVRIAQPQTTRNAKPMAKTRINESRTAVVSVPKHQQKAKLAAGESIDISSDESHDGAADVDGDEDELMDDDAPVDAAADEPQTDGHKGLKNNEGDDENNEDDDDEDHEPTFGDLVREHETVDVAAALNQLNPAEEPADTNANGRSKTNTAVAAAPTLASLGHLLNAALRSGDDANLEVCFNTTTDAVWIRNTIQRLDPSLAGALLQKLAARIHRRPGRAHTLVGWVQWTLITHGGALLANQAGVTRALQELHRVLEERARGLNSLLLLKGKLDMLEAQMQLRRVQRAGAHAAAGGGGGGGHSGVATVGGRSGSSKALDGVNGLGRARGAGGRRRNGAGLGRGARDVDDDEEFVTTYREEDDVEEGDGAGQILVNGAGVASASFIAESDEEALDDDDDDEDSDGDENDDAEEDDDLEEMDDDAAEEDEVDFDDVDDEDDEDEDEDEDDAAAAPPPKLQKKSGAAFSKRR